MTSYPILFGATAIVLGYVLMRFINALRHVKGRQRRYAESGVFFAVLSPAALLPTGVLDIPPEDVRVLLLGAATWMALALAFAAFAVSRAWGTTWRNA